MSELEEYYDLSDCESIGDSSSVTNFSSLIDQLGMSGVSDCSKSTYRSINMEPAEYSGLQTTKILYPPLNLKRIGYYRRSMVFDCDFLNVSDLPDRSDLGETLMYRLRKNIKPDCTVVVGEEEFQCHLIVLQAWSPVADRYNVVTKLEIHHEECTPGAFKFIYSWMLRGTHIEETLTVRHILDVLKAAMYLEIRELVDTIWPLLCDANIFKEYHAYYLYLEATKKQMKKIIDMMYPRIKNFFIILVCSRDWINLSIEYVTPILRSNHIVVGSEMEVFLAALRWLLHDWSERSQYKVLIMRCVRFARIEWWQLLDIQRNNQIPEFTALVEDPSISRLLDDALAYQISKAASGELPDYMGKLGLQEPVPRSFRPGSRILFTYREFLVRLEQLRHRVPVHQNMRRGKVTNT